MRVLVLGGTRFIGRHMVEALAAAGHQVSVFTRGKSPDELPASIERLHGDRDTAGHGLEALRRRTWDACIDVSGYTPKQVRPSAELLRRAVNRYLFVSTVSVYQDVGGPVLESHPLLDAAAEDVTEITAETYGPLKVTCERIVLDVYGDRSTILRPQIVAGPHDPTGRHTYWVQRATQGGEMLAPGDGRDYVQVVDVRDIARFTGAALERNVAGIFNMAGPRLTWAEFMTVIGARNLVWVSADILDAAGLTFMELPLFRPNGSERSSLMHVSAQRAADEGFTVTDPRATADDVRNWLSDHPVKSALPADRERELIAISRR
jgi:2'-hydroxyisoflavone reductase